MASKTNNGSNPAFSRPISNDETPNTGRHQGGRIDWSDVQDGLTKREYFAGLAMQGFLSNQQIMRDWKEANIDWDIARMSVWLADTLLEQLEKVERSRKDD